jgi:hypothetical protein
VAEIELIGGDLLRVALLSIMEHEEVVTRKTVRDLGIRLTNYAKREASGPARVGMPRKNRKGDVIPYHAGGPGVVTGTLRRSIIPRREGRIGAHSWFIDVAPGTPYSRRLELGFYGVDSLGRRYAQPAYPYMKPARDKVQHEANAVMAKAWRDALKPG